MAEKKVWLVTGAGRGMGVDIARAALAAGHAVVATGRDPEQVSSALGDHPDLLALRLDITSEAEAEAAAVATVERFGRVDVLVNNAGNFYAGFFEEISSQDFRAQVETNLFGPINVTRALLPVMRSQRAGLVVTISSTAGIVGQEFCTAYAASKFALEGWSESLTPEIAPVRHPHDARRARLLPHRAAHPGLDQLRRTLHRRLRRAHRADRHSVERDERAPGRRPGQARDRAGPARQPRTNPHCVGPRAPTQSRSSNTRPPSCSPRQTPTGSCPPRSLTTTRPEASSTPNNRGWRNPWNIATSATAV